MITAISLVFIKLIIWRSSSVNLGNSIILYNNSIDPLLKKSCILINFLEISFSVFRAIGKVHIMKKY